MARATSAFIPIYIADYLADTTHLTTAQHGAFLLLLFNYWRRGAKLPDNDAYLAQVTRLPAREWLAMRDVIALLFQIADGWWSNKRLEEELAKAAAHYKAKAEAGARGGKAKAERVANAKQTPSTATAEPVANECLRPTPSPSHSPIGENTEANASVAQPRPKPAKGTRLGIDWQPNENIFAYGTSLNLQPSETALICRAFKEYFLSPDATRPVKKDWDGACRRWIGREAPRAIANRARLERPAAHGNRPAGVADAVARVRARLAGEGENGSGVRVRDADFGVQMAEREPGENQPGAADGGVVIEADDARGMYRAARGDEAADGVQAGTSRGSGSPIDAVRQEAPGLSGGRGAVCAGQPAEPIEVVADLGGTEGAVGTVHAPAPDAQRGQDERPPMPDFLRRCPTAA